MLLSFVSLANYSLQSKVLILVLNNFDFCKKMNQRKSKSFSFDIQNIQQILGWAVQKECFSFVNGNNYETLHGAFPQIIFAGKSEHIECNQYSFTQLEELFIRHHDWLYGYFSYDLKNEIEDLMSNNPTTISFDHICFMVPETIFFIKESEIVISSFEDPVKVFQEIHQIKTGEKPSKIHISKPVSRTSKKQYFERIDGIKRAIVEGEYYEMNYCIEYTAQCDAFDPLFCYLKLNEISPMPFSAFMKIGHKYLLCASPERFLKKEGDKIISQPIKGTIKRSFDKKEDEQLKQELFLSEKERAENLMIVDLVRNDLAKSSTTGSVVVDELFGIYTFKKVHQMISTVSSVHNHDVSIPTIIKHAFPMGSMTGAPKIKVMQEIENLEDSSRGLYSGAVGYFSPGNNFDFNVVIRSLIYDAVSGKISFHVGSAITYDSDPENEYNECLLKAESLFEVLYN